MFLELGMCTEWKVKKFLKSTAVFSLSGRSFGRWAQALVAVSSKWSPGFNTRVHVGLVVNKEVTYFSNHFICPYLVSFQCRSSFIRLSSRKKSMNPSEAAVQRK
jgi:hypothetical protein